MRERIHAPGRAAGARRSGPAPSTRPACGSCAATREAVGYARDFTIYDDDDQLRLIRKALRRRAGRPQADRPAGGAGADLGRQEPACRTPRTWRAEAGSFLDEQIARLYRRYADALRANGRDGLRRPADADRPAARGRRRGARAATSARFQHVLVDEYQDTNHAQYRLVRVLGEPAAQRGGGGRRRPGDLLLARGRRAQHPRLRARLPRRRDRGPGAELPLHQHDPARRQRRGQQQPRPPRQEPLDRPGRGRADPARGLPRRARGGAGRRVRGRAGAGRRGLAVRAGGLLPDQRAEPGGGGPARAPRHRLPGDRRAEVLRAGRGARPAGLPARGGEPERLGEPGADARRAQARHRPRHGGQADARSPPSTACRWSTRCARPR